MKNHLFLLFSFLFLLTLSCKNKSSDISNDSVIQFPTVLDTTDFSKSSGYVNTSSISSVSYHVVYIGEEIDTLYPNYQLKYSNIPFPPELGHDDSSFIINPFGRNYIPFGYPKEEEHYYSPYRNQSLDSNLNLIVDTTQELIQFISLSEEFLFAKAYPVLIKNVDSLTLAVGTENIFPIIMEAKDSVGQWKEIEERAFFGCGTGIGTLILYPNEVALTSCLIYEGEFKAQLRLKLFKNCYSNVFEGWINYSQFEKG